MSIGSELAEALDEEVKEDAGRQVAEDLRDEALSNLEDSFQGAQDLPEFFDDQVRQEGSEFVFDINHPTAPLHERGGHIEPQYAKAMSMGWTRDGFYEALKDCNEWVVEKRYMRKAAYTLRREYR